MSILNNAFTGKLNLDQQEYRVPEGDFIDALNITRDSRGDAKDSVVANIDGNTWILYSLPFGVNKCIGQYADRLRNRVYLFIWNEGNYDTVLYYNRSTNTIIKLLENLDDTNGVDVLNFNPSFRINHVDIIYRDDIGDLLLWTDGLNAPREINVDTINNGTYSGIKSNFIELAKRPALSPPICLYGNDTSKNANNLRRTLFQFTARFYCDDYSKTTYSTFSKVPLPIGFYGSDNDIDNTNNNYIAITIPTGDENVAKIEIAVRLSAGALWDDFVTAVVLDKSALGIPDNDFYQYLFYNDNLYPPIPIAEQIQLFDWVPQKAFTQALPNGSTPVYAAITEGYNNIPQNLLDVTITAENKTNIPPDTDPSQMTYQNFGNGHFTFTVTGNITSGTTFTIKISIPPQVGPPITGDLTFQYTTAPGDTAFTVVTALYADVPIPYRGSTPGSDNFSISVPANTSIIEVQVDRGGSGGSTISTEKTWMWDANYIYGIVYVDEQNRDMPGVTTYTNPVAVDNDFAVTTPQFSEDLGNAQTPVISASINHLPPEGAVAYYWVRRRVTYSSDFIQYETCDFQEDADFYYFCLANIAYYKEQNSQFIYSDYVPTTESRIKPIAGILADLYNGDVYNEDYLILGTVVKTLTGGASPANDKTFLKVKKPTVAPVTTYQAQMLVQVYTPLRNPTTDAGAVFYEWGEAYGIYESGGVRYHEGMDQNQTASQPATFTWEEGDVYFHTRTMYGDLVATNTDTVSIMDSNFSDFFLSGVNDNGRPQAIESNAQQQFIPALVRFGQSYQSETTINEINRFYFSNFDEWDRSLGDVMKLFIEGRNLFVFQENDIGVVPVLQQIIKDVQGNPLQANSDQLLNKIQYPYKGKYGIGNVPESFAYGKGAKYGIDNNKGVAWRLAQDGITPLSIIYECNNFFVTSTEKYNSGYNLGLFPTMGNPTIYGVFNEYNNHVIWAFEEINRTYDINSVGVVVTDFAFGEKILTFSGLATDGITIVLALSSFGASASISYITQGGETPGELRDIFIDLINATTAFGAVTSMSAALRVGKKIPPFLDISAVVTKSVPDAYYQAPVTISFNESRKSDEGFESFYSYHPEAMGSLNNLLYTMKNGQFWVHENAAFNNFYGSQYNSSITPVFNGSPGMKKTYEYLTLYSSAVWFSPEIITQLALYGNVKQLSYLVEQDFKNKEGNYNAAFRRDINSLGGIINGSPLRGNYITIKLQATNPSEYIFINGLVVSYIDSPKNPR